MHTHSMLAQRIISNAGYDVTCAATGQQAIDVAARDSCGFETVLLDLTLPDLGGQQVAQRIRDERSKACVCTCHVLMACGEKEKEKEEKKEKDGKEKEGAGSDEKDKDKDKDSASRNRRDSTSQKEDAKRDRDRERLGQARLSTVSSSSTPLQDGRRSREGSLDWLNLSPNDSVSSSPIVMTRGTPPTPTPCRTPGPPSSSSSSSAASSSASSSSANSPNPIKLLRALPLFACPRCSSRHPRVIFCSGQNATDLEDEARACNADAFLVKPINRLDLVRTLQAIGANGIASANSSARSRAGSMRH